MKRRTFLNGSVAAAGVGIAGCLGDDDDDENCLPEDEDEFFSMDGDQVQAWAPSGNGFDLRVPRNPDRPSTDIRHERDEEDPTHWLDLTYSDEDDASYLMRARLFREEEHASADGEDVEPTRFPHHDPQVGRVDTSTVIAGSRGRFSYRVLAEGDSREDRAEDLFLMIPCVEEEHIGATTW